MRIIAEGRTVSSMTAPILHLFPVDMEHIYKHYIRFINTHFDADAHVFLLVGQGASGILEKTIPKAIRRYDNNAYNYDDSKDRTELFFSYRLGA